MRDGTDPESTFFKRSLGGQRAGATVTLAAIALTTGCLGGRDDGGGTGVLPPIDPTGASDGGGSATSTSGSGDGSGSEGEDTGTKFDLGSAGDGGGGEMGCQKIDFLFVVDNSGSMRDEQQNLINSFPGFMSTIKDTLEASYYHIMTIATDDGSMPVSTGTSCSNGDCSCTPAPVCCTRACGGGSTCNGFDCNNLPITECDTTWGAGKLWDENGTDCALDDGRRYMLHTQTDLDAAFACSANIGIDGSGEEKAMYAMGSALTDEINGPEGCNEGFLRDDAILVVTVITDEEDEVPNPPADDNPPGSPGDPPDWVNALVAAKGGNPDAVVFLALVGDSNLPDGQCAPGGVPNEGGAEPAPRIQEVANSLPFGVVGSVCAPDYTPFFQKAVSVIDAACEIYVPPG